jgi:hypothetical protein
VFRVNPLISIDPLLEVHVEGLLGVAVIVGLGLTFTAINALGLSHPPVVAWLT